MDRKVWIALLIIFLAGLAVAHMHRYKTLTIQKNGKRTLIWDRWLHRHCIKEVRFLGEKLEEVERNCY